MGHPVRDAWRLALGTFTAVPVTPPGRTDGRVAGTAMLLAPLTALPALAAWAVL
ncbi:MAG: Adenosylcobinamide-GDP ribazoletransferase, partial [Humibacillus sp.]|nr:Adenosylcobinamide-GDP ribazoletransferase [Humibacillus sp.]